MLGPHQDTSLTDLIVGSEHYTELTQVVITGIPGWEPLEKLELGGIPGPLQYIRLGLGAGILVILGRFQISSLVTKWNIWEYKSQGCHHYCCQSPTLVKKISWLPVSPVWQLNYLRTKGVLSKCRDIHLAFSSLLKSKLSQWKEHPPW